MAIISATSSIAGLVGVEPGLVFINTTDSYATVTTAGYLTEAVREGIISIHVPTATNPGGNVAFVTTTTGTSVLSVSITGVSPNLVYSLVAPANSSSVILPTTVGHVATYANTTGTLTQDPATAIIGHALQVNGNVDVLHGDVKIGSAAGGGNFLQLFPATAANGSIRIVPIDSPSGGTTFIRNAPQTGTTSYIIPDAGANSDFLVTNSLTTQTIATGNLALTVGALTLGSSGNASTLTIFPAGAGLGSLIIAPANSAGNFTTTITNASQAANRIYTIPDAGAATAQFLLNGGVATMQAGSRIVLDKTTGITVAFAVTIDKMAGVITTEALTTAAGASQAIALTNSAISATSVILCQVQGGSNTTQNISFVAAPGAGNATITIFNTDPAAALNGTIVFSFVVF